MLWLGGLGCHVDRLVGLEQRPEKTYPRWEVAASYI